MAYKKKYNVGDVYAIPLNVGGYGLAQEFHFFMADGKYGTSLIRILSKTIENLEDFKEEMVEEKERIMICHEPRYFAKKKKWMQLGNYPVPSYVELPTKGRIVFKLEDPTTGEMRAAHAWGYLDENFSCALSDMRLAEELTPEIKSLSPFPYGYSPLAVIEMIESGLTTENWWSDCRLIGMQEFKEKGMSVL